ncbi:putative hydrolase, NUDIX family protein [Babesia divergens]|uniref:Hydrolase, NUDIX family protein n=1 Tax=Babesia divergens TaxID=32595 RepID=A0AAD9GE81_BABDI|nr:putative hydrolase, NUDIX family protein [Babesia divergens]
MPESTEVIVMVDKDDNEVGTCTRKEMWDRTAITVVISRENDTSTSCNVRGVMTMFIARGSSLQSPILPQTICKGSGGRNYASVKLIKQLQWVGGLAKIVNA